MALQNSIYAPTPIAVTKGGTGNSAPWTDGQLLIGNTGNDPSVNTLTAGNGISIINGAGSITISSSASQNPWVYVNATSGFILAPFTNYFAGNGSSFIFPTSPNLGDMYTLCSLNGNAFTVSLTGAPGISSVVYGVQVFNNSITSQNMFFGSITFVCSSNGTNNVFHTLSPFGTFTGT